MGKLNPILCGGSMLKNTLEIGDVTSPVGSSIDQHKFLFILCNTRRGVFPTTLYNSICLRCHPKADVADSNCLKVGLKDKERWRDRNRGGVSKVSD